MLSASITTLQNLTAQRNKEAEFVAAAVQTAAFKHNFSCCLIPSVWEMFSQGGLSLPSVETEKPGGSNYFNCLNVASREDKCCMARCIYFTMTKCSSLNKLAKRTTSWQNEKCKSLLVQHKLAKQMKAILLNIYMWTTTFSAWERALGVGQKITREISRNKDFLLGFGFIQDLFSHVYNHLTEYGSY